MKDYIEVYIKSNTTGNYRKGYYTPRELLFKSEDDIYEELTKCNCEPIGEANVVECGCYEKFIDYELCIGRQEFIESLKK